MNRKRKRRRQNSEPGFPKTCDICGVVLEGKLTWDTHVNGKRHMREMRKKEVAELLVNERQEAVSAGDASTTAGFITICPTTSLRMCSLCSIVFSSPLQEQSHMHGKRHRQNIKKLNTGVPFVAEIKPGLGRCEICMTPYTSESMKAEHMAGKKHRKLSQKQGLPTLQPAAKEPKVDPPAEAQPLSGTPGTTEVYIILEQQAEETYEHYKSVAASIPPEQAGALYLKYQTLYKAYEAAYKKRMEIKENEQEVTISPN